MTEDDFDVIAYNSALLAADALDDDLDESEGDVAMLDDNPVLIFTKSDQNKVFEL